MIRWKAYSADVRSLAYSPCGRLLAGVGGGKCAWLWDPATGRLVRKLPGSRTRLRHVAFTPDGRHVFGVAARDDIIYGWDAPSGDVVTRLAFNAFFGPIAFAPDGSVLVGGRVGSLCWWEDPTRPSGPDPRPPDREVPSRPLGVGL